MDITLKRNLPSGEVEKSIGHASRFILTNVVSSAIKLMTESDRSDRHLVERTGCFKRVLPTDDGTMEPNFAVDIKAKYLFELLVARKG